MKDLRLFISPKRRLKGMPPTQEKKFDNKGLSNLLCEAKDEIKPRIKSDK